jgi:hypothetical protein
MANDDLPEDIPRLEEEIERLAMAAEGCRKIILVAKVAIAIGGVVLLGTIVGIIKFDQFAMIASLAAVLGGIVAAGSNGTTMQQATARMRDAEALRAELIDRLAFPVTIDGTQPQ